MKVTIKNSNRIDLIPETDADHALLETWSNSDVRVASSWYSTHENRTVLLEIEFSAFLSASLDDRLEDAPLTIGINNKYTSGGFLGNEGKEKIISGEMVKGIDWIDYSDDMPEGFTVVTI